MIPRYYDIYLAEEISAQQYRFGHSIGQQRSARGGEEKINFQQSQLIREIITGSFVLGCYLALRVTAEIQHGRAGERERW